jgi:hypothetical protein
MNSKEPPPPPPPPPRGVDAIGIIFGVGAGVGVTLHEPSPVDIKPFGKTKLLT